MQDISEDILVAAGEGNVAAFKQVYDVYSRFVYNVALRMVKRPEEAQEITQDVFLIIHKKLKDFRYESSFKTWIYRITVNLTMNSLKRLKKRKNRETSYDEQYNLPSKENHGKAIMDKEYEGAVTQALLNALNSDQRMCVVLRSIQGLSYEEIAETLGVKINTVRSRLKRAREKMLSVKDEVLNNEL